MARALLIIDFQNDFTAGGALAGSFVSDARLESVEPWVLAVAAGLLLHALSHDAFPKPQPTPRGRAGWIRGYVHEHSRQPHPSQHSPA